MGQQTIQPPLASQSAMRPRLDALTSTSGYDLIIRAIFICWMLLLALPNANGIVTRVQMHRGTWDLAVIAEVLARTGVLLVFFLAAYLAVIRTRPVRKAPGLQPRISALAGSFFLLSIAMFPRHDLSTGLNLLSAGLIFLGHMLAAYTLAWLGRSFSLMAERAAW